MWHLAGSVMAVLFLLSFAAVGYQLLLDPGRIGEKVRAKGIYIPFLELTRTRAGRVQVRAVGVVFLIGGLYMLLQMPGPVLLALPIALNLAIGLAVTIAPARFSAALGWGGPRSGRPSGSSWWFWCRVCGLIYLATTAGFGWILLTRAALSTKP